MRRVQVPDELMVCEQKTVAADCDRVKILTHGVTTLPQQLVLAVIEASEEGEEDR